MRTKMRGTRLIIGLAAALLVAGSAWADEVVLQSGGRLMGIATEEGDTVVVETTYGKVRVPRDMVLSIDRTKRSIVEDYRDRAEGVDMEDASEVYELAKWAKEKKMTAKARDLFQKVIEIDPDHEFARRELGYKLFDGHWMTEEEIMLAKGFIKFRGDWVTPSERALILEKERAEAAKREEAERKRRDARLARRKKEAEERKRRRGYREDVPEVWPTIDTRRSRGGYGYWPTGGVQLTHDYKAYIENIYGFYGIPSSTYTIYHWPFYRDNPWAPSGP